MTEAIAVVRDLHHTYLAGTPGATAALAGASLVLERGTIAALVGEDGAGKTTLVRHLNGLLRPNRTSCVTVLGQDLGRRDADVAQVRARVGMVFQNPQQQLFERFVGDDVASGLRRSAMGIERVRERVYEALKAVGLEPGAFVDRRTFALSGGEMRRVALAGVIAMQPELLVLDEATAGLDPRGKADVHALLRRLRNEQGMTVLIVTNDMDEVVDLADQVTVLQGGMTRFAGAPRELFSAAQITGEWGLALPPAARLAHSLRSAGIKICGTPLTPSELEEGIWAGLQH